MSQFSDAEHCLGFMHRGLMVDIYHGKRGGSCCEVYYELDDLSCFVCGGPLETEDVYQVYIADVHIPGAESPDESGAAELAMYIIDECPEALRDPESFVLARIELDIDGRDGDACEDDDYPEPDPLPGSVGDRFNRILSGERAGRSDLLDATGYDDPTTPKMIEDRLAGSGLSIVPAPQPPPRSGTRPSKDMSRRAMIAKQIHELKWWRKAKRLIDAARSKKK